MSHSSNLGEEGAVPLVHDWPLGVARGRGNEGVGVDLDGGGPGGAEGGGCGVEWDWSTGESCGPRTLEAQVLHLLELGRGGTRHSQHDGAHNGSEHLWAGVRSSAVKRTQPYFSGNMVREGYSGKATCGLRRDLRPDHSWPYRAISTSTPSVDACTWSRHAGAPLPLMSRWGGAHGSDMIGDR